MREPFVAWWPGRIKAGQVVQDMGSTLDFLPTILSLAGAKVPSDRVLDGADISQALLGKGSSERDVMFFYRGARLFAVRKGQYKAHYITKPAYGKGEEIKHDPPLLFHLGHDPSEKFDVAAKNPKVLEDIRKEVDRHLANLKPVKDQLAERIKRK